MHKNVIACVVICSEGSGIVLLRHVDYDANYAAGISITQAFALDLLKFFNNSGNSWNSPEDFREHGNQVITVQYH